MGVGGNESSLIASLRVVLEWSEGLQEDIVGGMKAMSKAEEIIEEVKLRSGYEL